MYLFLAMMAAIPVLGPGCASTDDRSARTPYDARWVVVSTNEPISSDTMEHKDQSSRVPAHPASVLLSADGQAAREEIETNGVPPVLKKKMLDGEVLTVADIEDLARYKISEGTILKYLQATAAIYILRTEDVNHLQQAGVSKPVIDYMLSTANQRPVQVVKKYYRYYNYDPWWGYGYYPYSSYYYPYYSYPRYYPYYSHGYYYHGGGGLHVHRP
jgi:hypothetical protein